jgi:uncharacterized protein (TIGR00251 family)
MISSFPSSFKIIVKPNSPKNKIIDFDKDKNAYRVEIKAKPEGGKANLEIIKFFTKRFKKKVKIIKGLHSRAKVLRIE